MPAHIRRLTSAPGVGYCFLIELDFLSFEATADLDALIARSTTVRTVRAWVYKEHLRGIL